MTFQETVEECINEALDDLAGLGEYWRRNRDKKRVPLAIRDAMLDLCQQIAASLPPQGKGVVKE